MPGSSARRSTFRRSLGLHDEREQREVHQLTALGAWREGAVVEQGRGLLEQGPGALPGLGVDPELGVRDQAGYAAPADAVPALQLLRRRPHDEPGGPGVGGRGARRPVLAAPVVPVAAGAPAPNRLLAADDDLARIEQEAQVVRRVGMGEAELASDIRRREVGPGEQRQDAQAHRVGERPQLVRRLHGSDLPMSLGEYVRSASGLSSTRWGVWPAQPWKGAARVIPWGSSTPEPSPSRRNRSGAKVKVPGSGG